MQIHGADLNLIINEEDANNSIIHYAVKNSQREMIDFLLLM